MQSNGRGILGVLSRQLKRVMSSFREKPNATLDDYLLEHFMLYHGLVGTSPENQPRTKDVRADIFDALKHKSSNEFAIAIKLPPLWWEDKLAAIIEEARKDYSEALLSCLLPPGDAFDLPAENDPLRHPDWRVRANAARILAQLQCMEAVPRLVEALNDEDPLHKAAFCYIAYAMGKLQAPQSRLALAGHLGSDEPWFRVDAAGALAHWPLGEVAPDLMSAVLVPHALSDYVAVVICRQHQPPELLRQQDAAYQEGAMEVIIGLLQAAQGTFTSETLIEARVHNCLNRLTELAREKGTPRRWRALAALCDWISAEIYEITYQDRTAVAEKLLVQVATARQEFAAATVGPQLLEWLRQSDITAQAKLSDAQFRHAANMVAILKLHDAAPYMVPLTRPGSSAVNEAIDALAELAQPESAPAILQLLDETIKIDERTQQTLNKQPVFEDDPAAAKTYWHLLRALGAMPTAAAAEYLLKASQDFAADKRQQALTSLVILGKAPALKSQFAARIGTRLRAALEDPSPPVRIVALQGVGELELADCLADVLRLTHAPETAVWRQASATVRQLHESGLSEQVDKALQGAVSDERDQFRRQRLRSLQDSLKN